jgi:hypothetical protein
VVSIGCIWIAAPRRVRLEAGGMKEPQAPIHSRIANPPRRSTR